MARNQDGATALHEAARNGCKEAVAVLLRKEPALASMVDGDGISPLYMAAAQGELRMVRILAPSWRDRMLPASFAGPDGRTALHAAALERKEMTQEILAWNHALTKESDSSGSTALHYAASAGKRDVVKLLLTTDLSLVYQCDNQRLFPVHIAAITGETGVIDELFGQCPNCDELVDDQGRNFLHCAIEHKSEKVVRHVCMKPRFAGMLNMTDYEGNTPLHLAIKFGHEKIVHRLLQNKSVQANMMNKKGMTPLDLAIDGVDHIGHAYIMSPQISILLCLIWIRARRSPCRADHFLLNRNASALKSDIHANMTQNRVIGSVLIATVTFAAAVTMPGGNNSDGTPNLAGYVVFEAFVVSDAAAFICSTVATCFIMYGGLSMVHPKYRTRYHLWSLVLLQMAVQFMILAFALAILAALVPARSVCVWLACFVFVVILLSLVLTDPTIWWPSALLKPIWSRVGWKGLINAYQGSNDMKHVAKRYKSSIVWFKLSRRVKLYILISLSIVTVSLPFIPEMTTERKN